MTKAERNLIINQLRDMSIFYTMVEPNESIVAGAEIFYNEISDGLLALGESPLPTIAEIKADDTIGME